MAAGDESYKLPMRTWLANLVDKGEIKELEWLGSERTFVKIPWTKIHHPGWENCEKVVQAWAQHQHREEKKGVKSDFTTLKANFRNAIHKSEDFEEDAERSELNNQSGNFKVFKILSRAEVEAKKKAKKLEKEANRKRKNMQKLSSGGKLVCGEQNFDDGSCKKAGKDDLDMSLTAGDGCSKLLEELQSVQPVQTVHPFTASQQPVLPMFPDVPVPNVPMNSNFLEPQNFNAGNNIAPAANYPYTRTCSSDIDLEEDLVAKSMEAAQCTQDFPTNFVTASPVQPQLSHSSPVSTFKMDQICRIFTISDENLSLCDLSISYNGRQVYENELRKMEMGYRVFYGDEKDMTTVLKLHKMTDEDLMDYNFTPISLPNPKSEFTTLQKILDKTDLGLILRYDSKSHSFFVKRLCQSQLFYTDVCKPLPYQEPIKIDRNAEVCVFSYEEFFQAYMAFAKAAIQVCPIVHLSIGSKSNLGNQPTNRGIKLTIIPDALKQYIEYDEDSGEPSLKFSQEISMEILLRQMKRFDMK